MAILILDVFLVLVSLGVLMGGVALRARRRRLPLPPGSMGWPYIGETFRMYSQNPNTFFREKERKYGPIFKTHILGSPCVMMSTAEAAKLVLVTRSHLFKPTFPASKERMLGRQAIFFQHGDRHAKLRKLLLRSLSPERVKRLLPSVDSIASAFLGSLQSRGSEINTFDEMKAYALDVAMLAIFGEEKVPCMEEVKRCYRILERGYNSMPIDLPGTRFRRAMTARKQLADMLSAIMSSRKRYSREEEGDLLSTFMAEAAALSGEQISDNVIGVFFASRDTTASVLTWILKFLADHPAVLASVTEEQQEIWRRRRQRGPGGGALSWDDITAMAVSARAIQETMRLASVLSFTFREAVQDVDLNGYLIPKGWKVMPLFRNIHHSSHNFEDPRKFDPSRFQVTPKPHTYIPFGSGIHQCPGNELAKVEMLVLLHHLTTNYRWDLLAPHDGIHYRPFALPCNGLPIRIHLKS